MGNDSIINDNSYYHSEYYISNSFTDYSNNRIQFNLSIDNCELNAEYSCQINLISNNVKKKIDKTEKKVCLDNEKKKISFTNSKSIEFLFKKIQNIEIEIFKNENKTNIINATIGEILADKNTLLSKEIFSDTKEILTIKPINIDAQSKFIIIDFEIFQPKQMDFHIKENKFYYLIQNNIKLYRSELISDEGKFEQSKIPSGLLIPNFQIEFYDIYNKKIFSINSTLENFLNYIKNDLQIVILMPNKQTITIINKSIETEKKTILNYLLNNLTINLGIGIDFTRSNLVPSELDSLHNISKGIPNNYEKIILSLGKILSQYNPSKNFPVFGFGAFIDLKSNDCFNINFQIDPNINTIEKVIEEYHKCINKIEFSGPTNVFPILNRFVNKIKNDKIINNYNIFLLLTDGLIDDMNNAIDILIESSNYPISVIIVGIGDENFDQMEFFNQDSFPMISRKNIKRIRCSVKFLNFSKFNNNENLLCQSIMEFLYNDIIEYYNIKNISPSSLKQ